MPRFKDEWGDADTFSRHEYDQAADRARAAETRLSQLQAHLVKYACRRSGTDQYFSFRQFRAVEFYNLTGYDVFNKREGAANNCPPGFEVVPIRYCLEEVK